MSLNIKNEETHRLVRQLAELTGMSQTSAVEDAVRRRLDELTAGLDVAARARRLLQIGERAAAAMGPEARRRDDDRLLYGPDGLPR